MEAEGLRQVEKYALRKQRVYQKDWKMYILRAMLASMFIGFGVIVAFKTGNYFYIADSPAAYPMAALTFGAAIILIAYGGADLFTGNTFYFTYAALKKKMEWKTVYKLWGLTYVGNLLGALVFAFLIDVTNLYASPSVNSFLLNVVEHKLDATVVELFFRAILCNWLVCLAFFVPMFMKENGAKLFAMILFVFCFFISGYEHSIANMCTFAIALVLDHSETITIGAVLHNLIPVTIGNMVGGVFMMGYFYYYINKPFEDDEEEIKH